jgi:hypothetical protein
MKNRWNKDGNKRMEKTTTQHNMHEIMQLLYVLTDNSYNNKVS